MVTGFSKKKIQGSKKTLGELLRASRIRKRISLSTAESETKIKASYLEAIEKSDWRHLPSEVYVRGFVIAYGKYLAFDLGKLMTQYFAESSARSQKSGIEISYGQRVMEKRVLITPKVLAYSGLVMILLVMISYIVYQLVGFAGAPNLEIFSPQNNSVVETDSVELSGATDGNTYVVVNKENVPVTEDGKFLTNLKLHRGVNVIEVKAINKTKKETNQIYTVEFKPKTAAVDIINNQ